MESVLYSSLNMETIIIIILYLQLQLLFTSSNRNIASDACINWNIVPGRL